jgi:transcriptional regulator with XRE-family HTH domain
LLAAALRELRLKRKLTQEALAAAAGITTKSYARIELGQSSPAWVTVRLIADALGVSLAGAGRRHRSREVVPPCVTEPVTQSSEDKHKRYLIGTRRPKHEDKTRRFAGL